MLKINIWLSVLLSFLFLTCHSDKDYEEAIYEIGTNVHYEKDLKTKIDSITTIINSGNEKQKLIRGYLFFMLGDVENANKDFKEIVQKYPKNSYALTGLATLSNHDSALKYINKAIRLNKNNSLAYFERSFIQENVQDKISDLDTAIKINPDCSMYYSWRGEQYRAMDSIKLAVEDFSKSISFNRPYPLSFAMLGVIYEENGQYNEALNLYNQLIERTTIQRAGHEWRGKIFTEIGKYNDAIEEYKMALLSPKTKFSTADKLLCYSISQNYSLLNLKDSTYKYLNIVLSLDSSYGKYLGEEKAFNTFKDSFWFKELLKKYKK